MSHPKEHKSRLGGYSYVYSDICQEEFSKSIEIENSYKIEKDEFIRHELENLHLRAGIKTILFAALSIEAAINDYAGWQLGDNFFDSHLSNLDVLSKWVVIPRLVCGESIDKSGPAYSALKKLVNSRNKLAHNKSRDLDLSDPNWEEKLVRRSNNFDSDVYNAYRAIVMLSLTMDRIVGAQFNPLKSFDKKVNLTLNIPENLQDVVNDCKNTIGKYYS